jgi:TatD DNase family protein
MKIFESHTHLDDSKFNADREAVIKKCFQAGVEKMINISCNAMSLQASIQLAEKYPFIYASAGFHPHDAKDLNLDLIKKAVAHHKVVAVGEIGLDYYRDLSPRDIQQSAFRQQLQVALDNHLPVIIHDRDAHEDTWQILAEYNPAKVVFHCFAGDYLMAEKIIGAGWHLSFTGNITYKKSTLEDIIRLVPDDQYFVETDSPYLTPHPHRGKRNDPSMLRYVIEKIARIKNQTPRQVAQNSWGNACDFFQII